jgi:hypothetical protein
MTDWTVDREFIPAFDRLSEEIDFEGCRTPDDIHDRIKHKQKANDFRASNGILRTHISKKTAHNQNAQLQKLIDNDFGSYVIAHARRHPDGIVKLTLYYGKDRAIDILLARARKRMRTIRVRRMIVPR